MIISKLWFGSWN